jgi:putative transposase
MGYTYIFYDYLLEIPQKLYLHLLKEVMFQFGSNWLQHYNLQKIYCKRKRISEFIIDETLIQIGKDYFWLWVAIIEPSNKEVLGIHLLLERNMIVAEQFLKHLVINYGNHV